MSNGCISKESFCVHGSSGVLFFSKKSDFSGFAINTKTDELPNQTQYQFSNFTINFDIYELPFHWKLQWGHTR